MAGGKKKTKKNKGSKGKNGNGVKTLEKRIGDEGVEVGDIISLVDLHKEGHELNIVNGSDNNNDNKEVETLKIDKKTKQTVSEESSPSKKDCSTTTDESGYQEANSSLLEKSCINSSDNKISTDLNLEFLTLRDSYEASYDNKVNQAVNEGLPDTVDTSSSLGGRSHPYKVSSSRQDSVECYKKQEGDCTDMSIEDYIKAGVPRYIAVMKHPLENIWTFWYQKNDPSVKWDAQMKPIVSVGTVEDFWQVYNYLEPASNLQEGQDYSLFKKGIFPDWSDFQNMQGGRLIVNMDKKDQINEHPRKRKERLEYMWLEVLLILIGEHTEENAHQVNGVTFNVKKRADRISVWLRNAADREGVIGVGKLVKNRLDLGPSKIYFQAHDQQTNGLEKGKKKSSSSFSPQKFFI